MGAAFSNPIDDAKQARIREIIQEVVGVFAKNFPLAFKDALIQKIKDEAQPQEEDDKKLTTPPIPDFELKKGMMMKRGDAHKNWKNRHFVALNTADNYRVDYFESEGGKLKGSIQCCGYRPQRYTAEEAKEHSAEFGLKLVPWDDRRRTWYMKCSSEEERADWMNVFQTACYKARPPCDKDPLIAQAFKVAYRATRWSYGYYGWYSVYCTEVECLGQFVTDILERELLNEVYNGIAPGPTKGAMILMLKKSVDTTVGASVEAAWHAGNSACLSMRGALESSVKAALGPIFEKEVGVKEHITRNISGKINPFLADVGGRVCTPIFRCVSNPFTSAFSATVRGVAARMRTKITNEEFKVDVLEQNLRQASREVNYWWSGPLEETNRLCYELYNGKLSDVASLFSGGYGLYDLYNTVLEKNRALAQAAIYTFGQRLKESEGAVDQKTILNEVLAKMLHDAKICEQEVICGILGSLLSEPIATNVTTPCTELVAPIQAVIDAIPAVSEFFNLSSMLEDIIDNVVEGAVGAIVDGGFNDISRQLDEAGSEIGVKAAM
jgi:hypothetical protein